MNWIDKVCREIAELPDRTSPDWAPDTMLVTAAELALILANSGDGLFEAIEHGDDKHRAWLKQAIADWFAGRPVQRL